MYALFKGDKQITQTSATKRAILDEALQRGIAKKVSSPSFGEGGTYTVQLRAGYVIRDVPAQISGRARHADEQSN